MPNPRANGSTQKNQQNTQFPNINTNETQTLMQCLAICKACAKKCIEEGQKKTATLCEDCAEACDLALKFKCCDSSFTQQALDLCAQICQSCAHECRQNQAQHCQECANICQQCYEACQQTTTTKSWR